MPSNIDLDEWSHTESRTASSSAHGSSTQSTNPTSRFVSRFSLIPGNISFRLSRTTSLGSSRPCPVSSAGLLMFSNEDELSLHNRNETQQCSEDASNNLSSNAPTFGFAGNMSSSPTLSPIQDIVR
ncbi:RING finger protein, partial [Trifolium medium]|nr:RING finger protein [Trifolium medium]